MKIRPQFSRAQTDLAAIELVAGRKAVVDHDVLAGAVRESQIFRDADVLVEGELPEAVQEIKSQPLAWVAAKIVNAVGLETPQSARVGDGEAAGNGGMPRPAGLATPCTDDTGVPLETS